MLKNHLFTSKKQQTKNRINLKKVTVRTRTAVITAFVLFLVTFLIHFMLSNVLPAKEGEITDWRFVCGVKAEDVEGDLTVYKQATAQNRVSREFGRPYLRMQYTIPASEKEVRLVVKTAYNPIKIVINGEQILNNGYGEQTFTGNSYQSFLVKEGDEKQLDIYVYAPLAFSCDVFTQPAEISLIETFSRYIGFGVSITVILLGVGLLLLSVFLAARSRHIRRLLMLSVTVSFGGITSLLYTYGQETDLLSSSYWFIVLLLAELFLMMLAYITISSCYDKAFKTSLVWGPVIILSALIPLFPTVWAVRTAAVIMTVVQIFFVIKSNNAFMSATTADVPYVGIVRGLLFYSGLIGIYNTCAMFFGLKLLSGYLFACSIALLCVVIFVIYCRQIIYLDIKKYERIRQLYTDSAWIEDITGLIAKMFLQKEETTFLVEIARGLSDIIEKNSEINDEAVDVHSCVGIREGNAFIEVFNKGPVEGCDYSALYSHFEGRSQKLLIGNTSADMLFQMDSHSAIIHFENILCGVTAGIGNIIKTAYLNLYTAYQNLNLQKDFFDIQEELFINLASVVEQKYKSTKIHLVIVSALVYELCKELGMSNEKAKLISLAAMTHDIGKISISENILDKKGSLTKEEFEYVKMHTEAGFNILSLQKGAFFETAAIIAREHHENFDGTGYFGLRGREISPAARLVRVVDVVDALLSDRSYKEPWSEEKVKLYLEEGKGSLFDPAVTEAFLRCAERLFTLRKRIIEEESQ